MEIPENILSFTKDLTPVCTSRDLIKASIFSNEAALNRAVHLEVNPLRFTRSGKKRIYRREWVEEYMVNIAEFYDNLAKKKSKDSE